MKLMAYLIAAALMVSQMASAQSSDDLQPAVQTSNALEDGTSNAASRPAAPAATAGAGASAADSASRPSVPQAHAQQNAVPRDGTTAHSVDRIELGTTQISGNRELPKLMYIVPWQHPQIGQSAGRPPNSLVDEALTPVDRDVFERENSYYAALQAAASHSAASTSGPRTGSGRGSAAGSASDSGDAAHAANSSGSDKLSPGTPAPGKDEK